MNPWRFDSQLVDISSGRCAFFTPLHQTESGKLFYVWQTNIVLDRKRQNQALRFSIFCQKANAGIDCIARRSGLLRHSLDEDSARIDLIEAENRSGQFGAPGA